jgi:Peptidase family S41
MSVSASASEKASTSVKRAIAAGLLTLTLTLALNAASPPETFNHLDQTQLQGVIDFLRSNYVDPRALTNEEINGAAVAVLLTKLGPGAKIERKQDSEQSLATRPFKSDLVQNQFSYIRLGNLTDLASLDSTLNDPRTKNAHGLVLDLRTMPSGSDFRLAAGIISRFVPKGTTLFKLVQPKKKAEQPFVSETDRLYSGPLAVLIRGENSGTAEAVAGALQQEAHALLIGQKTAGQAAEYKSYPLGSDLVLNVAVSELVVPDGKSLFPAGVAPDITVSFQLKDQETVLSLADSKGISDFIVDDERPRTNEAALVAGKNPDLDAYEADQAANQPKQPKDLVLQRAIDFLTTVNVYRR